MATPGAPPKDLAKGIGTKVALPSLVAAGVLWVLGALLSNILADVRTLGLGLIVAWFLFSLGRALGHLDLPRTRGMVARKVLTGVALGVAGMGVTRALFVVGPASWVLVAGFGFGIYRAHAPLLKLARERPDDGRRFLKVFHRTDLEALAYLVTGYAILGVGLFAIARGFFGGAGGQLLAIGTAIYALQGARLLLKFASEERAQQGTGVVAWLKANALQNGIVALLLVGYAVFRDDLARSVPFFPLIEFGLGVAVFTFVLARLRARIRRDGSLIATASEARDHERVVLEIHEADFDSVARPVTRFVESGVGAAEYARALQESARLDDAGAARVLAPLAQHREPPRTPALPLAWALGAGLAACAGFLAAGIAAGVALFEAEWPFPLLFGLLLAGLGGYALQDRARAHMRPWLAVGIAGAAVGVLVLDVLLFFGAVGALGDLPGIVWGILAGVVLLMMGVPTYTSWRLQQRIDAGNHPDARRLAPARELAEEIQKARRRAATMTLAAFTILLPLPWLVGWLGERFPPFSGFPAFLDKLLAVAIWIVAGLGAAALLRFYGLTRHRPLLLAREKEKRERRLALHKTLMRSIEKV